MEKKTYTLNVRLIYPETESEIAVNFFSNFFIKNLCFNCEFKLNIFDFF